MQDLLTSARFRNAVSSVVLVLGSLACGATPPATDLFPTAAAVLPPSGTSVNSEPAPGAATVASSITQAATHISAQPPSAFTVAAIVDMQSEPVTREQAQTVVTEASGFLIPLTAISLLLVDFVEDPGGGSTQDMASRYVTGHATALPNGLVIFSFGDGGRAKLEGGYGYALAGPAGFSNAFVSPVTGGGHLYVEVVHFSHKYAPCGYGGSETVQGSASLEGECRGQTGMACTQHNGYSMCTDAVPHLWASTPTYLVSSTMIHELVHLFSTGGDMDHYSTPECNSRMGYPAGFFDLQESQYHNGLCPDVYAEFSGAYRP
jgi:hypothetical protein